MNDIKEYTWQEIVELEGLENCQLTSGCCEPGYDDKPVILENWNNVPGEIYDNLEEAGFLCEWDDEWLVCDGCYKAFRCSPDSYSWSMYGHIGDGEVLCGDCIAEDPEEYLEELENNPKKCVLQAIARKLKLEDHGYTPIEPEFDSGLHRGMDADPEKILAGLLRDNPGEKFIFVQTDQSQFYISFQAYLKTEKE